MDRVTDLELCKRIAKIVGFDFSIVDGFVHADPFTITDIFSCANMGFKFNPLTDDALWQRLIFKYEVSTSFVFCKLLINHNGVHEKNFTDNESLKRNALLLIIESRNET